MAFRGYFALNDVEIANSSRVAAHIGATVPVSDVGIFTSATPLAPTFPLTFPAGLAGDYTDGACALTETASGSGIYVIPSSSVEVAPGIYSPPDGSRLYDPGLFVVGDCWDASPLCGDCCHTQIGYDDSWPGLQDLLGDMIYRPELAPWYSTRVPESAEFGGVWVLDVKGLGATPVARPVSEMVGAGAAAGPHRDSSRTVTFDALLIACTNAGLEYGLSWLTCQLRGTNERTDSVLRYLAAHPGDSAVYPGDLVREVHNVVLTKEPQVQDSILGGGARNRQATMYRVQFELTVLHPYAYFPPITVPVDWDSITAEPIEWIHAADCTQPESCDPMPVMFSADCVPETIDVVTSPPPSCGGCMPVCEVDSHVFAVPTFDYPLRCNETAVSVDITNVGEEPLTLQGYWRICSTDERCDDNQWPIQVSGLPASAVLHLDGITGRFWAVLDGRMRRPVGVVGTPTGAPWRPAVIDRSRCWEFVVIAPGSGEFDVSMTLIDRQP